MPTSLIKQPLHRTVADSIYKEILSRTAKYYYLLGQPIQPTEDIVEPDNSYGYELDVRNKAVLFKEVKSTDVAFVTDRVDWKENVVYDKFDDKLSTSVIGVNLTNGGSGYLTAPDIVISGDGVGATAISTVLNGVVQSITLTSGGIGYSNATVTITGVGSGAEASVVFAMNIDGTTNLETSNMFVLTDDYNVYKCIDNNSGLPSTIKPVGRTENPIKLSDGYIWKYMYNINIGLRNKFLTTAYIPVVNSVREQFYTNGEIINFDIISSGTGYTTAGITVSGNGYLKDNPLLLKTSTITNGGTGYTSATVTVDAPFKNTSPWSNNGYVITGQKITSNNNVYEVIVAGQLQSPAPVHKKGDAINGTTQLRYIGTTITGTATISGGVITNIIYSSTIDEIPLTTGGSGYLTTPNVTLTGNGTAQAVMNGSSVLYIKVIDGGTYTTNPSVTIGNSWIANTAYTLNEQISSGGRLYTVSTAGTTNSTAPTHTTGTQANGTTQLTYVGQSATATVIRRYGSGYSSAPIVTITGNGTDATATLSGISSNARLYPILNNGSIVNVVIAESGIGYTDATLTVTGNGTGAIINPDLSVGDVESLQSTIELLVKKGQILNCPIVSRGHSYISAPAVNIIGDGTGATATCEITNGQITKINMVDYGQNYTYASVQFGSTIQGTGASARCIISPFLGHGKDSIKETYSSRLMFYSNLNDTVYNFNVDTAYRQVCLVRNPFKFGVNERISKTVASSCFVLGGSINLSLFHVNDMLNINSKRFKIISIQAGRMLVSSIDNYIPITGQAVYNANNDSFTISSVLVPDIDKYSGEMLFIDNRKTFQPTEEQSITLRTLLKF